MVDGGGISFIFIVFYFHLFLNSVALSFREENSSLPWCNREEGVIYIQIMGNVHCLSDHSSDGLPEEA